MTVDTTLSAITGITTRQRAALGGLGIRTAADLLRHFPYRHEDFTTTSSCATLPKEGTVTVVAAVVKVANRRSFRRRLVITEATIKDETGEAVALWFHQPYLAKMLKVGDRYRFAGKMATTRFGTRLVSPLFSATDAEGGGLVAPLLPVYPLSKGISQFALRKLLRTHEKAADAMRDPLDAAIRSRYRLCGIAEAIRGIHFPATLEACAIAKRRLAFDELLGFHLAMSLSRRERESRKAFTIPSDLARTRAFVASLPFTLTVDQRRAAWEVMKDMGKPSPMHRLLDGDVGSGKTAVAAVAIANVAAADRQSAVMAPTEILAKQHYETLRAFFRGDGIGVALWTNAYKRFSSAGREIVCDGKRDAEKLRADIADGGAAVVVGTHALIEEGLRFSAMALAVIDEQHRFGVDVRRSLTEKSGVPGVEPHLLTMTATPIPRSLALTMFGDLEISILKEKPRGRQPIETRIVPPSGEAAAMAFVRGQIAEGRQAFIVCPAIDPSDLEGSVSVIEAHSRISSDPLRGMSVGMLHGKMTSAEKEAVMRDFAGGALQALVATTVVEVGVDVPNATVMCVMGAERFGLAQLHQLRGRIGRGRHRSTCLLFPSSEDAIAGPRLSALVATDDGFALAEKDLRLRGPGDLLGEAQSGFPQFRIASLGDAALIRDAKEAAVAIMEEGSDRAKDVLAALRTAEAGSVDRAHLE